jgi:hypothetical protein
VLIQCTHAVLNFVDPGLLCTRREIIHLIDGTFTLLPDATVLVNPDWDFRTFACYVSV